jgi:hypothetical protein
VREPYQNGPFSCGGAVQRSADCAVDVGR